MANLGLVNDYQSRNSKYQMLALVRFSEMGLVYRYLIHTDSDRQVGPELYILDDRFCIVDIVKYDEELVEELRKKGIKLIEFKGYLADTNSAIKVFSKCQKKRLRGIDLGLFSDISEKKYDILKHFNTLQEEEYIEMKNANPDKKCEKCGGMLTVKKGKFSWFYGCTNYPTCKNTAQIQQKIKRFALEKADSDEYCDDNHAWFGEW